MLVDKHSIGVAACVVCVSPFGIVRFENESVEARDTLAVLNRLFDIALVIISLHSCFLTISLESNYLRAFHSFSILEPIDSIVKMILGSISLVSRHGNHFSS